MLDYDQKNRSCGNCFSAVSNNWLPNGNRELKKIYF